ncbi:MAG: hypothetical protein E7668_02750 [Ruminococcaceae bacterium]|nr:hypothetical protein [Oscillospiraceae bacterium]
MKRIVWLFTLCMALLLCCISVGAEEMPPVTEITDVETEPSEDLPTEQTEAEQALSADPVDWQTYIEEELLPLITMVLTVIAGIYVAISPILAKIKKASEKFKSATEDVNTATGTVKSNEKKIGELEEVLSRKIEQMEQESAANRKTMLEIEQMLRLGLGNMNELVMKGCARSIVQIGQDIEETLGTVDTVTPQEETDHEAKG